MAMLEWIRGRAAGGADSRRRRALALTGATLAVGMLASLAGGMLWRANVRQEQRHAFDTAASDVTATLQTMLRRDADFVAALRSIATMEPQMSATRFERWFVALQGRTRQTGSLGTGVLLSLPTNEVVAFQRARNSDPAFRAFVGGHSRVELPDGRARMCLPAAGASGGGPIAPALAYELQDDWCDPRSPLGRTQAQALRAQAETGRLRVLAVHAPGVRTTLLQVAFYRPGATLATAAERRAALAGWVGSSFDLAAAVRLARGENSSLGLALYHRNPGAESELVDRLGPRPGAGALRRGSTFQIEGPWSLAVTQFPSAVLGLPPDVQGLLAFLLGASLSALLASTVLLLARSRERALGLVRHQALHDALTGLPNRALALDRLEQMLARARREGGATAALRVDLDGFKCVNETFGHEAGDELLRVVAHRLQSLLRGGDTAARLSGDEFVVLLEDWSPESGPERLAQRVLEALRRPYELRGVERRLSLTASVGVATASGGTAGTLLQSADLALYEAKAAGRNRFELFEESMKAASQDRATLELDLAEALQRGELTLLYQPTFELATQRIVGAEALLRWEHPTRGRVGPEEFVPIAEENGTIVPIGRWVLGQACRQAAAWARGGRRIGVAVNVSARQIDDDGLLDDVRRALADSSLDPSLLTLEITETALMRDTQASVLRLLALKRLGVKIAIDDFGTGYSSLAYLRQLPADVLKIDRAFVAGVASSGQAAALIRALVQLGSSLGIATLAEGIEDDAQLHALQLAHCELGQGYLLSRPVAPSAVAALLERPRSFPAREHVEDPMARI